MRNFVLAAAVALTFAAAGCGSSRPATGSDAGCGSCHGFPPATLTAGGAHPQPATGTWVATNCAECHPTSVDSVTGEVKPAPGGTHANGIIEGGHALDGSFAPGSAHGPAANAGLAACTPCHGANLDGIGGEATTSCDQCHTGGTAAWRTNCTFCHGTFNPTYTAANLPEAAPPEDVAGAIAVTDVTVGVHQAHVTATVANPLDCSACHGTLPGDIFSAGHLDASPAEVPFGAVAGAGGRVPTWDRTGATCASTWCHDQGGPTPAPVWTTAGALGCGACHPTPPTSGQHPLHLGVRTCGDCHAGFTATTVDPALHVDGLFNIPKLPTAACHPFSGGSNYGTSCDGRSDW